MARAMQQIRQELAALGETVANFAAELYQLYSQYLNLLSQSARKQLILASYQICTHAYPESFLILAVSDRERLQNHIKQLSKTLQAQLLALLETPMSEEESNERLLSSAEEEPSPEPQKPPAITNPEDLVGWCKHIELSINEILEASSQQANLYLQEAQILPSQVPAKVLEIAMQTDGVNTQASDSPNLLNLLVETERDIEDEPVVTPDTIKISKLTAIHLRRAEIEFADTTLNRERDRIRHALEKLSKIQQYYRKIQREYASAEAESAWRATWYED